MTKQNTFNLFSPEHNYDEAQYPCSGWLVRSLREAVATWQDQQHTKEQSVGLPNEVNELIAFAVNTVRVYEHGETQCPTADGLGAYTDTLIDFVIGFLNR